MSNDLRNEVTITIAGEERTMRATFGALRAIEQTLGTSVLGLVKKAMHSELGIFETAVVIFNGLKGFDDTRLSLEQVGEGVVIEGLNSVTMPVLDFIGKAMKGVQVGKPDPAKEPE